MAFNCGLSNLSKFYFSKEEKKRSQFISYSPCSFHEYISKKVGFFRPFNENKLTHNLL